MRFTVRSLKCWFWSLLGLFLLLAFAVLIAPFGVTAETDLVYGEADGQKLRLDLFRRRGLGWDRPAQAPVLLMVHGGGWTGGSKKDHHGLAQIFARFGYVCICVDYRLVTPQANQYPAALDDVQRAVRWVRANAEKCGVDPDRIGALGDSAGGHLVSLLGTVATRDDRDPALAGFSSRVNCVVNLFGLVDLVAAFPRPPVAPADVQAQVDAFLGRRAGDAPDLAREASPLFHIDRHTVPFLNIHGAQDPLVPLDQSRRFDAALREAGIESELIVLPDEGHGVRKKNRFRFFQATLAFLKRHLKG